VFDAALRDKYLKTPQNDEIDQMDNRSQARRGYFLDFIHKVAFKCA